MMVSHDQAVGRNERARAAGVESDGSLLQVLQPLGCGPEIISLLQDFGRRVVKKPHTFVSLCANRWNRSQSHGKCYRAPARQTSSHTALLGSIVICESFRAGGATGHTFYGRQLPVMRRPRAPISSLCDPGTCDRAPLCWRRPIGGKTRSSRRQASAETLWPRRRFGGCIPAWASRPPPLPRAGLACIAAAWRDRFYGDPRRAVLPVP